MSVNSGNVYSSINLSKYMSASLPKGKEPQLRNSYDGVAVLCNACMVAVGFRLVGLGEDHKIGQPLSDQLLQLPPDPPESRIWLLLFGCGLCWSKGQERAPQERQSFMEPR